MRDQARPRKNKCHGTNGRREFQNVCACRSSPMRVRLYRQTKRLGNMVAEVRGQGSSRENQTTDHECASYDSRSAGERVCEAKGAALLKAVARPCQCVRYALLSIRGCEDGGVDGCGGMQLCISCGSEGRSRALVGLGQRFVGKEHEGETRSGNFDLTHVVGLITGDSLYVDCANGPPV